MPVSIWQFGNTVVAHGATWDFKPDTSRDDFADAYAKNPIHAERDFGANPPQSVQTALHDQALVERLVNKDRTSPIDEDGGFHDWFVGDPKAEYFMHIDMSKENDDTGMGMCHYDLAEDKYVVDLIHTIQKTKDWKLSFERIFHIVLTLKEQLGFNLVKVTFDSWQSYSTIERLTNKGIPAGLYSVDRGTEAYDTLIETILLNKLDYYLQARFIQEMKELKLYKGSKYDHPPQGSKDTSDGVAGCVANCVMARVGLALTAGEVEMAIHEEQIIPTEEFRTSDGSTYHVIKEDDLILEAVEKNRKRVIRIDATDDYIIFIVGWNDKIQQRLFVDSFLVWEDYTNAGALDYIETFIAAMLRIATVETFSLNANIPIELVNFIRGTGRRVSSPLSNANSGRKGNSHVAKTGSISEAMIRTMVSQIKKGNLVFPRHPSLIKDLKFMTDDNQRDRKFVGALAGWTDFISREATFGRTAQVMPRSIAASSAPINSAVARSSPTMSTHRSGAQDLDRIRSKYSQTLGGKTQTLKNSIPSDGQKRLPRARKLHR